MRAIVDPEQVRVLSRGLRQRSEAIQSARSQLESSFRDLEQFWNDDQFHRFDKTYREAMEGIDHFLRKTNDFSSYLQKKAELAERYQRRR